MSRASPSRPIGEFLENHYRHFNAREVLEAARGYVRFVDDDNDGRRRRAPWWCVARRRDEHRRDRQVARAADTRRPRPGDIEHRGEHRGGSVQPRRSRPLRRGAPLALPVDGGRSRAETARAQPRHRYLHTRGRHARAARGTARALAGGRGGRPAALSLGVPVRADRRRLVRGALGGAARRLLGRRRVRARHSRLHPGRGGLDAGQHVLLGRHAGPPAPPTTC